MAMVEPTVSGRARSKGSVLQRAIGAVATAAIVLALSPAHALVVPTLSVTKATGAEGSRTYKGTLQTTTPTYPQRVLAGQPQSNGDWDLSDCKTTDKANNFCDDVPVFVDPGERNGHRVLFEIIWHGNNTDLSPVRLYDTDGVSVITTLNIDAKVPPSNADQHQRGVVIDLPKGTYHLGVDCNGIPCPSQYTAHVKINYESIYCGPECGPVGPGAGSGYTPPPFPTESGVPTVQYSPPPAVLTPGADGPTSSRNLKSFAVGQQASPPSNSAATATNIVVGILLAGILLGGGGFVAMKVRRDLGR